VTRFRIGAMVDAFVADPRRAASRDDLARLFSWWRDLATRLEGLAATSPLAAEALPAGQALGDLGAVGLEAVEFFGRGVAPPDGWLARVTPALDRAERPLGLLRLPFAPAIRRLVTAAAAPRP
jgi:hexosaminidase